MAALGSNPTRLGIFFFYDKQGVVDSYVEALLEDMSKNLTELVVVINGVLSSKSYSRLEAFADRVIKRENRGLDVWAYKTAMDRYGWERLTQFDEVVLFNSTIMGPVYPFAEMFEAMASRDIDFWGPTWFHEVVDDSPDAFTPEVTPRHIQSHFHVYRRSLVSSPEFQRYWDKMGPVRGYTDSVAKHEIPFTEHFEKLGFTSDVYVNTEDMEGFTYQPIIFAPVRLIRDKRCPIFKRRSFFHDYEDVLDQSVGNATGDLYAYLRDHTDFDVNLIWDNALRTMNLADLVRNLHLTYVLPTACVPRPPQKHKLALIIHVYYLELLGELLDYARSMPEGSDIIITVGSQEKADQIRDTCKDLPYNVIVRTIKNRGRDVAALMVGVKDLVADYDLVCFIHDKKVTQILPYSVGEGFARKCFDNVLATPQFVDNVIATFDAEPRLGLLTPTPPNHADYFPISAFAWGPNFDQTEALLKEMGLEVPMSQSKEPIAPLGSTFWFRPKALAPLFEHGWTWEDFPPEPLGGDGTISHAIERAHCYVAQSQGYFSGWLFSDRFASLELTNLGYYTRELTRAMATHGAAASEREMVFAARHARSARQIVKDKISNTVSQTVRRPARLVYRAVRRPQDRGGHR